MDRRDRIRTGLAIIGAVGTVAVTGWFAGMIYPVHYPTRPAYKIPDYDQPAVDLAALQRSWPEGAADPDSFVRLRAYMGNIRNAVIPASLSGGAAVAATPQPVADLGTRLAQSDKAKGQKTAQVCTTCHSFDSGGPNRVGPGLWGVVGRPTGSHSGFAYSSAMASHGGTWTYEQLDKYLTSPARVVPGNKMAFAGIRNPADRANVLAFLGSLNASPAPFPKPQPQ